MLWVLFAEPHDELSLLLGWCRKLMGEMAANRDRLKAPKESEKGRNTLSSSDDPGSQRDTISVPQRDYRSIGFEEAHNLEAGARHYRAYVGNPKSYDLAAATQFGLMVSLGLREHHRLLDIGCGSLCGGRLFIPYLLPDRYYAIEPQAWLIEDCIRYELGEDVRRLKRPTFRYASDFSLSSFDMPFDFMLAHSVLTHVSQNQLDRCLFEVKSCLKPEGLMAASFFSKQSETYRGENWIYPDFASYPMAFVTERAKKHGLNGYPLIWTNRYDHYWMVFAHTENPEQFCWLANLSGEQRVLQILELTRELNDLRRKYADKKEKLVATSLELAKLRDKNPPKTGTDI